MLPIERKSVEPLAAHTDPLHVSSQHQSLHHLVAMSEWSDTAVLERVRDWVMPWLGPKRRFYWIVDDTSFPKKGTHSVGVARQYCGQLGKHDNCQVAVSLSLASERASVPIEFRLYLPEPWAKDQRRRKKSRCPQGSKISLPSTRLHWSNCERRSRPGFALALWWRMPVMAMTPVGARS